MKLSGGNRQKKKGIEKMEKDYCSTCSTYTYHTFNAAAYAYVCESCNAAGLTYWAAR